MATLIPFRNINDDDDNILQQALRRLQEQNGPRQNLPTPAAQTPRTPIRYQGGYQTPDTVSLTDPNHTAEQQQETQTGLPEDLTVFGQALGRLRRIREAREQQEPEDAPISLSGSYGSLPGSQTNRGVEAGTVGGTIDLRSGTITPQPSIPSIPTSPAQNPLITPTEEKDEDAPRDRTPLSQVSWSGTNGLEMIPLGNGFDFGTDRAGQRIRELTDQYNARQARIRDGNTYDYLTDADYDEVYAKWEAAAPEFENPAQYYEYYQQADDELNAIANRRAEADADLMAEQIPGISRENDLVYRNTDRPAAYINPFNGTAKMEADLAAAEKMLGMIVPGTLNDDVNGRIARETIAEINKDMAYVTDPEKSLEDVRADLEQLRALKEIPSWAGNADLQQRIWQQERQEALLEAYIKFKGASKEELDAAAKAQKEFESKYEGTWGEIRWSFDWINEQGLTMNDSFTALYRGMTQDELTAYWLLHNEDPDKATQYFEKLAADINKRNYQAAQAGWQQAATDNPVLTDVGGSLMATAVEPFKWTQSLNMIYRQLTGREIDVYSAANSFTTMQAQVRPAVRNDIVTRIANNGGNETWQYLAGEAYDLTENVLDNVFRNLSFGWIGAPSWLSTAAMSVGTVGTNALELSQNTTGMNQNQIMLTAGLRAVSEFATEALSDARFFEAMRVGYGDGSAWQRIGRAAINIAITGTVEASTEVLNDIDVDLIDALVLKEEGRYNRSLETYYRQAIAGGEFGDDAEAAMEWAQQQATKDTVESLLHTFVFSAVSGGVMEMTGRTIHQNAPLLTDPNAGPAADADGTQTEGTQNGGTQDDGGQDGGDKGDGSHETLEEAAEAAAEAGGDQTGGEADAPTGLTPGGQRLSGEALEEALRAEKEAKQSELDALLAAGKIEESNYNTWMWVINDHYSVRQAMYRLEHEPEGRGLTPDQAQNPLTDPDTAGPDAPTANGEQGQEQGGQEVLLDRNGNTIPENAVGVDLNGRYYTSERELARALRQQRDERMKLLRQGLRNGSLTQEYVDAQKALINRMMSVDYARESLEAERAYARNNAVAPTLEEIAGETVEGAREGTNSGAETDNAHTETGDPIIQEGENAAEGTEGAEAEGQINRQGGEDTDAQHTEIGEEILPEGAGNEVTLEEIAGIAVDGEHESGVGQEAEAQHTENGNPIIIEGENAAERAEGAEAEGLINRQGGEDIDTQHADNGEEILPEGAGNEITLEDIAGIAVDDVRESGVGQESEAEHAETGEAIVQEGENAAERADGEETEAARETTQQGEATEAERTVTGEAIVQEGENTAERADGEETETARETTQQGETTEAERTVTGEAIVQEGENAAEHADGEETEGQRQNRSGIESETTTQGEESEPITQQIGDNVSGEEDEEGAEEETEKMHGRVEVDEDGNRFVVPEGDNIREYAETERTNKGEEITTQTEGQYTTGEEEETGGETEGTTGDQNGQTIAEAVVDGENAGVVLSIMEKNQLDDASILNRENSTNDDETETETQTISETTEDEETEETETQDEWWSPIESETVTGHNEYATFVVKGNNHPGYMTVDQVTGQRQTVRWIEGAYMAGKSGMQFDANSMPAAVRNGGRAADAAAAAQQAYQQGQAEQAQQQQEAAQQTQEAAQRLRYNYDPTGQNGRNGVNFVTVTGHVSDNTDAQLRVLDAFGKKYGMRFNVYDSVSANRNATYQGGRTVSVGLDADAGAIVKAASHEAYHYVQEYAPGAAADIRDFVLEKLRTTEGYDLTTRIQQINEQYARSGIEQTDAESEIVADSMIDALADGDIVSQAMTVKGYLTNTVNKIADHIQRVGSWLRSAVQQLAGHSPEVRALGNDAQYVQEVGRRLQAAVQLATFNRRARADGSSYAANDQTGIVNRFYDRTENGMKWADSLRMMLDEVYEKTQKSKGDSRDRTEARPELIKALNEFTSGEKSLNKALEDHGFKSVEGAEQELTAWAARRLEQGADGMALESLTNGQASAHYDDFTDWILGTENQFSWLDDTYTDFQARELIHKLFVMTKQGISWAGQQEKGSIRAGEWSSGLKDFVNTLKSQTQTRMGVDALIERIRSMYLALDNALLKGNDFSIGEALRYAQDIAEEMTNRAGRRVDTTTDDYLTDFARYLRGTTIWLTEAQQDEAIRRYDSVQGLVRAYWGTAHFTTNRSKGGTTLEDIAREYAPLFNLGDMTEGDLFERLDLIMEQYARQRDAARQVVYEGGLSRSQMEQDITMRLIWGYFNMPNSVTQQAEKATRGKTKSQEDFRDAIKEARKEFDARRAELEAEYAEKMAQGKKENQAELAHEKARIEYEINKENEKYLATYREALEKAKAEAAEAGERVTAAEQARAEANVQLQNALQQSEDAQKDMQEEIDKRVEAYKKTLENMLKGMVSQDQATQQAREAVRKRLEALKEQQHRQNLRNSVIRQLNRMEQGLLKPSDKKHIPEVYRTGIIKALQTVDTSSLRKQDSQRSISWRELQAILMQMDQEDTAAVIDPNLQISLDNLENVAKGKKLMDMSTDQLQEVSDVLAAMQRMMDNYDKMLTDRNKQVSKTFTDRIRAIAEQADPKKPRNGLARTLADQVEGSLLDPKRWTQWLGRATSREIGDGVWNILHGGLEQQIRDVQHAEELMAEAMKDVTKAQMREMYGRHAGTLTLHTMGGDIKLTVGQVMEIYMGLKRGAYANHLLGVKTQQGRRGGGITLGETRTSDGTQQQIRPVHVTEQQVHDLVDQLTPEQKQLAEKFRKVLDWCSEIGNETSRNLYGYNKYKEKYYYPIKVDSNYNSQTINQDFSNPIYKLKNQGFTKNLVEKANAPIRIGNIFDTVTDHVVEMINYHAWVQPVMDMTRILNNRNMEEVEDENGEIHERVVSTTSEDLEILMGRNGKGYALQLLKDINGIAQDEIEKKAQGLANILFSRFKGAAVSWNLSTAAKQPWSIIRGFDVIPSHYFLPGRVKGCTDKITDLMNKYAPIYAWKQYGNFTMETGKSLQSILLPQAGGKMDKFNEMGMWLAGQADNMTWRNIWRAAEKMTAARNKDLTPGTEAFYRQAAVYFNECIDQTQVVDSILHRTQIMRGKGVWTKIATSFMGEPLKTFNTFVDKARAVSEDNTPENRRAFARTATVYLASAGVQALVASVISALRHMADDEPTKDKILRYLFGFGSEEEWADTSKTIWDKMWTVYTSNIGNEVSLISKVPVLRDALELIQGYSVERADLNVIKEVVENAKKLWNALQGKGSMALPKAVSNFAGALVNSFGIPAGNILNELWHLTNWIPRGLQEAAGIDTMDMQYTMLQLAKEMGASSTLNDYILLMRKAQEGGRKDLYDRIYNDLIRSGVNQTTLDKKLQGIAAGDLGVDNPTQYNMAAAYMQALQAGDKEKADTIRETYLMTGKESGWSTAIMQQVRQMPEVAEANARRRNGDISAVQELVRDLRDMGLPEEAIIKGIASEYGAEYNEAGSVDKWGAGTNPLDAETMGSMENAADVGVWTYTDLAAVVQDGNMDDAQLLIGYLRSQGKSDQAIRNGLTKKIADYYHANKDERETIKRILLNLGIGYTEKTIDNWGKK